MTADHRVSIATTDGHHLAGHLFTPEGPVRAAVVVHGGFAIPQRFYGRIATALTRWGFAVLTYDHRGIGESRRGPLRGFDATATQWGRYDWGAATRFLRAAHPDVPLLALCHSFGGQALGIADEGSLLDGVVTIGSQLGSLRHYSGRDAVRVRAAMHVWLPLVARVFGYVPRWAGLGEDTPLGATLEWATWCRSHDYLLDHVPGSVERFAALTAPVQVMAIADDDYAPRSAVEAFAERLTGADLTLRVIRPEDLGVASIGHFAAFRPAFADTLWVEIAETLLDFAGQARRIAAK